MKAHLFFFAALLAAPFAWAHGDATQAHADHGAPQQQAWGIAGNNKQVTRTVTLSMGDNMRFQPAHLEIKQGETLRLRVRNQGQLMHEIVLGTRQDFEAHAAEMRKHPGMAHDAPHMAHVAPGKTGEVIWTFNRPGTFEFACLVAGHFEAGMRGTIRVSPAVAGKPAAPAQPSAPGADHGHTTHR